MFLEQATGHLNMVKKLVNFWQFKGFLGRAAQEAKAITTTVDSTQIFDNECEDRFMAYLHAVPISNWACAFIRIMQNRPLKSDV